MPEDLACDHAVVTLLVSLSGEDEANRSVGGRLAGRPTEEGEALGGCVGKDGVGDGFALWAQCGGRREGEGGKETGRAEVTRVLSCGGSRGIQACSALLRHW